MSSPPTVASPPPTTPPEDWAERQAFGWDALQDDAARMYNLIEEFREELNG